MAKRDTLTKLRRMGYSRSEDFSAPLQREAAPPKPTRLDTKNFKGKILNHTIMDYVTLEDCNYDSACVTGSIFRNCKFINCSMDQADFEFCEFYHCEFRMEKIFGCSFNGSSFVDTSFCSVHFDSCTFTGAFFQKCPFDGVKISYSTLENAAFKQCSFFHMDMRYLNMDYIDLDHPYMEDVTLPISQTAFMFGALQYLKTTKNIVFISKGDQGRMTPKDFFNRAVPLLRDHFSKTRQFFPLANICFTTGETCQGTQYIKEGILDAMGARDFRMLKHFCKLTACNDAIDPHIIRDLYHNYICRIFPQYNGEADIPNYARHIMDIKALLFSRAKRPMVTLSLETNIPQGESQKMGKLVDWLFSIAKRLGRFKDSDIDVVLRYGSPLSVTIRVSGTEGALAALLSAYLGLTGISHEKIVKLPVISAYWQGLPPRVEGQQEEVEKILSACRQELSVLSVHLSLLEYYVENFQIYSPRYETGYYFNSAAVSGRAVLPRDLR